MRVYLCGPINGRSDSDCKDWRAKATVLLVAQGLHEVVDPMARDFRGKEAIAVKEIVEGDKADIDTCDVILVYFDKPSVGTSMEVLYAWERGKLIIVVHASEVPVSPWMTYHSKFVVGTIEEAHNLLNHVAV